MPTASEWIRDRLPGAVRALEGSPSPNTLVSLGDTWRLMRSQLAGWNDTLTKRATELEAALGQLAALRETWTRTRDEARESRAPAPVLERIEATLAAIAKTRASLAQHRTRILGLGDRVVREMIRCDDVLARIAQSRKVAVGSLFARDGLPIWSPETRKQVWSELGPQLRQSLADNVSLAGLFLAGQGGRVLFQIALFVVLLALMRLARTRARRRAETDTGLASALQVFELPVSSALLTALLAVGWIYPQAPVALHRLVAVLILLPSVLIVRRVVSPSVVPAVYALAVFFLADRFRDLCSATPVLEQWVFLLEMVFGIVFLALVLRSDRLRPGAGGEPVQPWLQVISWIAWAMLGALGIALLAGVLGYMRVARLLGGSVLVSNYVAMVLYAGVRVAQGLIAYLLRARPLRLLLGVERHRDLLQRCTDRVLRWLAVALWGHLALTALGLMDPIWSSIEAILDARFTRGSLSISLGDIVAFGLTIWAALLLSRFVRFILEEDVYPRVGLARGLPYAMSSLVHYVIVALGFLTAVAALGVDLNRITIVAGAFGVGIGIGLQGVVANFVSGLILLLERRIHVGDAVQIGDMQGEVREIGIRSSVVRTWEGAEVIVPNGDLTSSRVSNWTLSDRLRRIELQVGAAYGSDPERVMEILREAARAHPKVLAQPAPMAVCTGFGESALTFVLWAWVGRLEDFGEVRSQLAVTVQAALAAAKIEIPFPQRDIHIRGVEGEQRDVFRRERGA